MGIQPSVDRKDIHPIGSSGIINPTVIFNIFHVGLKSHTVYLNAGDMASIGEMDRDRRAPIGWTCGPPDLIKARALIQEL